METGKTELSIGGDVKLTVDKVPAQNSTNLLESGGVALQDYEHNYALVLSSDVPSYDSTNKTLTLKEGSLLIHPNIEEYNQEYDAYLIVLNDDVVFTKPDSAWRSHYLILNTNTLSTSFVPANNLFNLSRYEIPIALIRWNSDEILNAGFNKYIKDGVLTDIISNNPDSVKQVYRGEFALVSDLITINTISSPKSLTIPSGARIISPNFVVSPNIDYITLSTSVTLEKPNTSWNTHYVIYNSQSNSLRAIQTNQVPIINSNECLICIVRWSDGYIINSNQSGYYINDILMDAGGLNPLKQTYHNKYVVITGNVSVSTTNGTLTLKNGTRLVSPNFGIKTLSADLTLTRPTGTWNTHYVVYNYQTNSLRAVQSNDNVILSEKEALVCLLKWSDGILLESSLDKYYINDTLFDNFIEDQTVVNANLSVLRDKGFFTEQNISTTSLVDDYFWWTNEEYSTPTLGANSGWKLLNPILVKKGDVIVLRTLGGANARAYVLTDVLKQIYERAPQNADYTNAPAYIYVSRDGYLYVNNKSTNTQFAVTVYEKEIQKTQRIYNPAVNLKKENLRILDIGNSYTADMHHYLPQIIEASGISSDYSLYRTFRGGSSFKTWVDCYYDQDDYVDGYAVAKTAGNEIEGVSTGYGDLNDGSLFREALSNGNWDIIIIHQVSDYSNCYTWNSNGADGYLKELIRILRKTNPNATIGSYLVASYRSDYVKNTEKSSLTRWQHISTAIQEFMVDYGVDFIIPYGTAIQSLRASSISDQYEFSTDGLHLADGIGDYCAACTFYQMIFAPRSGISILGNTWRKTDFDLTVHGVKNIDNTNAALAQIAAYCACYDMFEINNPDNVSI